jgi:hypothetical protein
MTVPRTQSDLAPHPNSVFIASADPDLGWGPLRLRQTIALQALLFERPVIQDNFLLCGQAMQLCNEDPIVEELLRMGVLSVALRSTAQGLYDLSNKQARSSHAKTFHPFIGDSADLYAAKEFAEHAARVDRARAAGSNTISWTPTDLGSGYRDLLAASASGGELATNSSLALQAFDAVERKLLQREGPPTHSCSDYYDTADQLFSAEDRSTIKAWARWYYLLNLPTKLGLCSWLPSHVLKKHPRQNLLSEVPWRTGQEDLELSEGLFNAEFLASIPPEAILELRSERVFGRIQTAMEARDMKAFQTDFDLYKSIVHGRVGEFLPESYRRGKQLKTVATSISRAGTASSLLGAAAGGAFEAAAGALGFVLGTGLGTGIGYGVKVAADKAAEHILNTRSAIFESAFERLRSSRFRGDALSLLDFIHNPSPPATER